MDGVVTTALSKEHNNIAELSVIDMINEEMNIATDH